MASPAYTYPLDDEENKARIEQERLLNLEKARTRDVRTTPSRDTSTAPNSVLPEDDFKRDMTEEAKPAIVYRSPPAAPASDSRPYELNIPLVSSEGGPLGLSAAYAGPNYSGEGGVIPQGAQGEDAESDDDTEEEYPEHDEEPGGIRASVNRAAAPIMSLVNNSKIRSVQRDIDTKNKELKALKKKHQEFDKKEVAPIRRQERLARFYDAFRATRNYVTASFGVWWWTVIGAIIDLLVVIPFILILFGTGAYKGKMTRTFTESLKKKEAAAKKMQKDEERKQNEIRSLEAQKINLTRIFSNPGSSGPRTQ